MSIRAIITDLDDTLFMTEYSAWQIENATAGRMGIEPMSRETHLQNWGVAMEHALPERFPGIDVDTYFELFPPVLQQFIKDGKIDQITGENLQALNQLAKNGYQLLALSSRNYFEIEHLVDPANPIAMYIPKDRLYYADITTAMKPDPQVFDVILVDHGLSARECLYIGDSMSDCVAAKKGGMHFVACLESGLRKKSSFEDLEHPPDGYVDRFANLPSWLLQYQNKHAHAEEA